MNCPIEHPESAGLLLDYCGRKLAPDTTAMLERHMGSCARCQAFRDGQMALWRSLDAWESMPVSAGFDRRLYGRLHGPHGDGPRTSWWSRFFGSPLSGPAFLQPAVPLALACVIVLAGLLVNDRPDGAVAGAPRDAVEAEQVETVLEDFDMLSQLRWQPRDATGAASRYTPFEAMPEARS